MDPELLRACAHASVGAAGPASPLTRAGREPLAQGGQKGGAPARPLPWSCAALPSRRSRRPLWAPGSASRGEAGAFHR